MDEEPQPKAPLDEWCRRALFHHRVAQLTRRYQKQQDDGSIPPDVQKTIDGHMRLARETQVKHERETGQRFD